LGAALTALQEIVTCSPAVTHTGSPSAMYFYERKKLIDSMSRTAGSVADGVAGAANKTAVHAKLVECTSPVFGGFAGISGTQRSDDPGSAMEQTRPYNGTLAWWTALTNLGNALDQANTQAREHSRTLKNSSKVLRASVYGDTVSFKFNAEDIDNLLFANVRTLATPTLNASVLAFDEHAWALTYSGSQWSFTVADFEVADPTIATTALTFAVSSTDTHAGKSKPLSMTRCPGTDNAMNILRFTPTSTAFVKRKG